jgi:phosphate starvation-inducible PhoH-like protein
MSKNMSKKPKTKLKVNEISPLLPVSALNAGQKNLLKAIANPDNSIIIVSGVAGTGKTHLSVSWGLEHLFKQEFNKIVLTRPVVEAGEKLGFLKGSYEEKLSPYMIPIFDVLNTRLSQIELNKLIEDHKIVTLPIAFMRGNTFQNSFVLLDEAQNTTKKQMHLFLTRIGKGSKMVITGDPKQSDLGSNNGFVDALERFRNLKGLEIVELAADSIVRHSIIADIDERYSQ